MLKAISAIGSAVGVKQERERYACLLQPDLRSHYRTDGNHDDAGLYRLQFRNVRAQLRHMLAAAQSTQVTEEDEQGRMPTAPGSLRE